MKHTRIAAALILLALMCLLCAAPAMGDGQLRVPRVISIIYDDSSSMDNSDNRDFYTQYALNVFLSMLDEEDAVYVTYMSDPYSAHRLDMSSGPAAAIRQLNAGIGYDLTPFACVQTAINALTDHRGAPAGSQHWLIVITDGEFLYVDESEVNRTLKSFLETKMPNGTLPMMFYIGIGLSPYIPRISHPNLTLYPESGSIIDASAIISTLQNMSSAVSSRAPIDASDMTVQGNTLTFTTALPSYSFAVLNQGLGDTIDSIVSLDGTELTLEKTDVCVRSKRSTDYLDSECYTITSMDGEPLPAGTYTITFSGAPKNVDVLTEPALALDLSVTAAQSGSPEDEAIVAEGFINVKGTLRLWNEQTPIDPALLPQGTLYSTALIQEGSVAAEDTSSAMELTNVDLNLKDGQIVARVTLPGIGTVSAQRSLDLPDQKTFIGSSEVTYKLREFCDPSHGIIITRFENDVPIAVPDNAAYRVRSDLPLMCERQDDGTFFLRADVSGLTPLARYGTYDVLLDYCVGDRVYETYPLTYTILDPVFAVDAAFVGSGTVLRTDMWKSEALAASVMAGGSVPLIPGEQTGAMTTFTFTLDGEKMTREEIESFGGVSFAVGGKLADRYPVATALTDDGTLIALPYAKSIGFLSPSLWHWTDSWYRAAGTGEMTASIADASDKAVYSVVYEPLLVLLLSIGLPILLLLVLLGYVFKRRFPRSMRLSVSNVSRNAAGMVASQDVGENVPLRQFNLFTLLPFVRSRAKVNGVTLVAATKHTVMVRRRDLPGRCMLADRKASASRTLVTINTQAAHVRSIDAADAVSGKGSSLVPFSTNDVLFISSDGVSGKVFLLTNDKA